ncbi:MAG: hypothetical protein V4548_11525 [Bacteroidota bacterium]
MKTIIIAVLTAFTISLSAQNRYSQTSTSSYTPSYSSPPNYEYYQKLAEKRTDEIHNSQQNLYRLINQNLERNVDDEFRVKMEEVKSYLKAIKSGVSIEEAESYLKKANRLYNRAVKKYNKRINQKK